MSLTSSLQRIVQAKADIKTAIENKGVTVGNDVSIANYDDYIDAIQTGSSTPTQTKTVALSMASGDQVISPDTGYALSQVTVEKPSTLTAENIKSGVSIGGVTGSYAGGSADPLDGIVDGSITSFTMPSGKTKLWKHRFDGMTSLTSADLTGCTEIQEYAFNGCTNLATCVIPNTITSIPQYAFNGCTSLVISELPSSITEIQGYGMQNVSIQSIDNEFSFLGGYAIRSDATTKLHVKLLPNGNYQNSCIETYYVTDFDCSESTYNGGQLPIAFAGVGSKRSNPSSNILTFDFRKCTSTSLVAYTLSWGSTGTYATYSKYFFPSTITTIQASSLGYSNNCEFYFASETPPTLSGTNAFNSSSSYKIFVPYDKINTYKNATNWTTQASYINGYAAENTFDNGDTLPTINNEGYQLTWYSDSALTQQVTTVSDKSQVLYCVSGASVVAYFVRQEMLKGCSIVISDGVNTYGLGDYIMANTTVTITGVPTTAGDTAYVFTVNGTSFTSGDTFTVTADIKIKALYWDGVTLPYDSVLANNTWAEIKEAAQFGVASSIWSVGDTKTVTGGDGNTHTFRIVDLQTGRYQYYETGDPTHITFEEVECSASSYRMSTSSNQTYPTSPMYKTTLPSYKTTILGEQLSSLIETIYIKCKTNYASSNTGSANYIADIFLPAYSELFPSDTTAGLIVERVSTYTGNAMAGFDYYVSDYDVNGLRRKSNNLGYQGYFTRSPNSGTAWRCVLGDGSGSTVSYSYYRYIAFCFAW